MAVHCPTKKKQHEIEHLQITAHNIMETFIEIEQQQEKQDDRQKKSKAKLVWIQVLDSHQNYKFLPKKKQKQIKGVGYDSSKSFVPWGIT